MTCALLSLSVCLIKEQWSWSQEGVALVASPVELELTWRIIIIQLDNKDILLLRAEEACKTVIVQKKMMHQRDVRD